MRCLRYFYVVRQPITWSTGIETTGVVKNDLDVFGAIRVDTASAATRSRIEMASREFSRKICERNNNLHRSMPPTQVEGDQASALSSSGRKPSHQLTEDTPCSVTKAHGVARVNSRHRDRAAFSLSSKRQGKTGDYVSAAPISAHRSSEPVEFRARKPHAVRRVGGGDLSRLAAARNARRESFQNGGAFRLSGESTATINHSSHSEKSVV